jgi:hypothetical protein
LIDQTPRAQAAVEKSAEVQAWLRTILQHGPVAAVNLWRQAENAGHSERRVRRAMKVLNIKADCAGYQGRWHYWLTEPQTEAAK